MDIDLSDIQTVVLTPVAPAIVFAAIIGIAGGAIVTLVQLSLEYREIRQWWRTRTFAFAYLPLFYLALFGCYSVILAAVQLSMIPTTSLREVNRQTIGNVVILCFVLCFSRVWQTIRANRPSDDAQNTGS